jgi:hypothetical protein
MTAPNIVNVTSIYGKTNVLNVPATATAIVENTAASNTVIKVNSMVITNIDGTNTADITLDLFRSSTAYKIVSTVPVAADTSFIAIGKDYPLYLEEGDSLRLTASVANDLTAICSYEVIS